MPETLPTYQPPPALAPWQLERLRQGFFDWVLPSRLEWFPTSQAAVSLNMSPDAVVDLVGLGRLEAQVKQITGSRKELNISRRSILLYIAVTSTLDPKDLAKLYVDGIRAIKCPKVLQVVAEAAVAELKRRAA